ncbi:MAG: hypothetical protein M3N95_09215 [Actinomycetota bacterium]|nr:hypothetical protein [Actinomycetota bacterium]
MAGSQGAFLRAVDEHPDTSVLRVDALEHVRAVAWVVASTASWSTLTARPTWPVLQERTGLSRASVARWLRWLRLRGLLGVVESGTTPRFAPMALDADAGNRAALYVLCVPAPPAAAVEASTGLQPLESVEESETPTFLAFDLKKNPYAGARATQPTTLADLVAEQRRSDKRGRPQWPRTAVAGSRFERLALVETLQAAAPALRPASALALRSELRPWLARTELGWNVRWLLHALDHTPDGQPHPHTAQVRMPVRWLRYRMSFWVDEHGQPSPSPGAHHVAVRSGQRADAAAKADERRAQAQQIEDEQVFGDLVRDVAGSRYPALVAAVRARDLPICRLLPAAAVDALTREAVRALIDPGGAHGMTDCRGAVTTAVRHLLGDEDSATTP